MAKSAWSCSEILEIGRKKLVCPGTNVAIYTRESNTHFVYMESELLVQEYRENPVLQPRSCRTPEVPSNTTNYLANSTSSASVPVCVGRVDDPGTTLAM